MDGTTTQTAERSDSGLRVRAQWTSGPRTAAWERLWRVMLSGLNVRSGAEHHERLGREDADG